MPFLAFALIAAAASGCLKLGAQSVMVKVLGVAVSVLSGFVLLLVGLVLFVLRRSRKEKK